ncbi:Poly [ADP-ribose] polymerase, partial [Bienertia sinuspersici]
IKTAFEQYGTVTKIQFIPNYTEPQFNGKFALVKLENEKQAKETLKWLDPNDPDFEVGQKLKNLSKKHIAEQSFLLKKQIEEEEKRSRQQAEALKAHYQKFDMMDSLVADGSSKRLSRYYGVNLTDDKGL